MKIETKLNPGSTKAATFSERFCAKFQCHPEEFETTALLRSFFPASTPLARLLLRLRPTLLAADLAILREVGEATTFSEVQKALSDFWQRFAWVRREWIPVRISQERLVTISLQLFAS